MLEGVPKPHPRADRLLSEEQVWERLSGLIDERLGLVIAIEELESQRLPLANCFAYSLALAPPQGDIDSSVRQTQSGCSARPATAVLKAVAEAVERYSGRFQPGDPYRLATLEELGETAIHPDQTLADALG